MSSIPFFNKISNLFNKIKKPGEGLDRSAEQQKSAAELAAEGELRDLVSKIKRDYYANYKFPLFDCGGFGKFPYSDTEKEKEFLSVRENADNISATIKKTMDFIVQEIKNIISENDPETALKKLQEKEPAYAEMYNESETNYAQMVDSAKAFRINDGKADRTYKLLRSAIVAGSQNFDIVTQDYPYDIQFLNIEDEPLCAQIDREIVFYITKTRFTVFVKGSLFSICSIKGLEICQMTTKEQCTVTISGCGFSRTIEIPPESDAAFIIRNIQDDFTKPAQDLLDLLQQCFPENNKLPEIWTDLELYGLYDPALNVEKSKYADFHDDILLYL